MKLYKYLTPERLDVLRAGMIRYTQPGALNDPFESRPHVAAISSTEKLMRSVSQLLPEEARRLHGQLPPEQQAAVPVDVIENFLGEELGRSEHLSSQLLDRLARLVQDIMPAKLDDLFGMLCLSEVRDSLLMWSHYASEHRGLVIGFDAEHPHFDDRRGPDDELCHLRKVEYRQNRPSGNLEDLDGVALFLVKSIHWAYEREWRILRALRDAIESRQQTPHPICLFSFPPEAVVEVIFGARMGSGLRDGALELLTRDDRWRHVQVLQAVPDERLFELRFEVVSRGVEGKVPGAS